VASLGWGIGSWVTMRNARIQHTINIIFARFPHATFGDNQSAFFAQFGAGVQQRVSTQAVKALEGQTPPNKGLLGLRYLLNYYEFIAVGILRGDLDFDIINQTLRTPMAYLYDKCEPYIVDMQRDSPTLLENYAAVRDALREP
jgi:hypothetical protein